ncbi:hypothetical protein [Brevibacillus fortis]|uniref:hypothetical protein n=1 Tax=Brevibacillus fortis TaxID=2126352 RepID=UPI0038FC42C1
MLRQQMPNNSIRATIVIFLSDQMHEPGRFFICAKRHLSFLRPYDRLFLFITLVLPGKKTDEGWEYYQVKLLDGMLPVQLREFIHNPKFAKQVAAYRKNKSSKNVDAAYQAVRQHYNLNIRQDSPAISKVCWITSSNVLFPICISFVNIL